MLSEGKKSRIVLTSLTDRHRSLLRQINPTDVSCTYKLAFETQATGELLDCEPQSAIDDDVTGSDCVPSYHLPVRHSVQFPICLSADSIATRDLQHGWLVCNTRHRLHEVCIHNSRCSHSRTAEDIPLAPLERWKKGRTTTEIQGRFPPSPNSISHAGLMDKSACIPFVFRHQEQTMSYMEQYRNYYTYRRMQNYGAEDIRTSPKHARPGSRATRSLPAPLFRNPSFARAPMGGGRSVQDDLAVHPGKRLLPRRSVQPLSLRRTSSKADPVKKLQRAGPRRASRFASEALAEDDSPPRQVARRPMAVDIPPPASLPVRSPRRSDSRRRGGYLLCAPSATFTAVLRMMKEQEMNETRETRNQHQ